MMIIKEDKDNNLSQIDIHQQKIFRQCTQELQKRASKEE